MPTTRVIYNFVGLYAGPAPSSGYHFVSGNGLFNNDPNGTGNINLVRNIKRVQNITYSIEDTPLDVQQLGKRSSIHSASLSPPNVKLNFNYFQHGVLNENRLGMYVNYTQENGASSGEAFYSDNFGISLLSGFEDRNSFPANNTIGYPYSYRDGRNLFVAIGTEGFDLRQGGFQETDPQSPDYSVLSFGNCYMTSYNTECSVGAFPRTQVSYECDNVELNTSGSGVIIPAVESKSGISYSSVFSLPSIEEGSEEFSVLLARNISLSISSKPELTGISAIYTGDVGKGNTDFPNVDNLMFDFDDLKIQNYSIGIGLPRRPLFGLGHTYPTDKRLNFPIFADISFGGVIGDTISGSLVNLLNQNDDYDFTIDVKNPGNSSETVLKYSIKRAKFINSNFSSDIGENVSVDYQFKAEIDPDDLSRGLFMSGKLNVGSQILTGSSFF